MDEQQGEHRQRAAAVPAEADLGAVQACGRAGIGEEDALRQRCAWRQGPGGRCSGRAQGAAPIGDRT